MLILFPTPLPDELLYSILARYHIWSANRGIKHTVQDLFGTNSACAIVDLPVRLQKLCDMLPEGTRINPEKIIKENTMLPLYYPFLPVDRADKIYRAMIGDSETRTNDIQFVAGAMGSKIPIKPTLRFCPECLKSDEKIFGEPYWHRLHQAFGACVCPEHQVLLMEVQGLNLQRNRHKFIPLDAKVLRQSIPVIEDNKQLAQLLPIAKDMQTLLNCWVAPVGLEALKDRYDYYLTKCGYRLASGRIKQKELVDEFRHFYGDGLLNFLECSLEQNSQDNWLSKMVRKPRTSSHPIRHILLLRFLNVKINDFFSLCYEQEGPFGNGPWPCLNPACKQYKKNVIKKCEVSRNTGKSSLQKPVVGTFTCQCGFSYARSGPSSLAEDCYHIGRIKSFGEVWDKELLRLNASPISLRQKARCLGVDPSTVKRRLSIFFSPPEITRNPSLQSYNYSILRENELFDKKKIYRIRWMIIRLSQPKIGITGLKKQYAVLYSWLIKHDNRWLMNNLPPQKRKDSKGKQVDWQQRDMLIAKVVETAVYNILNCPGKPVRLTVSSIAKEAKYLGIIQKKLFKLPITQQTIEKYIESDELYWTRKISYAITILKEQGQKIKPWKVLRIAGIKDTTNPVVVIIVDKLLKEENPGCDIHVKINFSTMAVS